MPARSRRRRRRRLTAEINVVPYIDVMLVLLIIFMVTAPLLKTGVEVDLPNARAKTMRPDEQQQPIILTVNKNGAMYLNVAPDPEKALSGQRVRAIAAPIIKSRPDVPVSVKGDGAGTYASVVRAMVLLQRAGAQNIGLQTDNVEPDKRSGDG